MISTILHEGSGLGNQLHSYVMCRVLALDKGTDFGIVNPWNFKGDSFMNLDMGKEVTEQDIRDEYHEKSVKNEAGHEIRDYDWEGIKNIHDGIMIDGYWQGENYFIHHLDKIREWLKVEPLDMPDDLCIINFRGGEYVGVRDLFLPEEYWQTAIDEIVKKYPNMRFEVHTDDPETARSIFTWLPVIHDVELNWRSIRYAKHLILSNSSFAILPALLNEEVKEVIAPMFWAGHNKGYWQLQQNVYKRFTFI